MQPLDAYKGMLPYASELFGVYQPLLGWKSKLIGNRYAKFRVNLYNMLAARTVAIARTAVRVEAVPATARVLGLGAGMKVTGLQPST